VHIAPLSTGPWWAVQRTMPCPQARVMDDSADLSLVPDPAVVRLSSPADLVGVVPWRLGFHPTESLVVICLEGPRRRDRLVMRIDLADPRHDAVMADDLATRVRHIGASAALLAVYTGAPDGTGAGQGQLPRARLVRRVSRRLEGRGVAVPEAVLVRDQRWWSYRCHDPACCPPAGTPMPRRPSPAATRWAAEAVAEGATVLPDRAALVASVEPAPGRALATDRAAAAARAETVLASLEQSGGPAAVRERTLAEFARLRSLRVASGIAPDPDAEVLIALGLRDTHTRDRVMTAVLDDDRREVIDLLRAAARAVDDGHAAPVCAALAWVAYCAGEGALAAVAVDRALRCEPGYSLAGLLASGIDGMVPPAALREVSRSVRDDDLGSYGT
jgi:hypothetical protein